MTDEEIQQEIQKLSESLDKLADPDKPLSKEERKHKYMLLLQKETLEKLKQARETNNKRQEFENAAMYGVLTSWGEKHPFLLHLARIKLKWTIF
jgi:hypothetical protein